MINLAYAIICKEHKIAGGKLEVIFEDYTTNNIVAVVKYDNEILCTVMNDGTLSYGKRYRQVEKLMAALSDALRFE